MTRRALFPVLLALLIAAPAAGQIAVRGDTVHTMAEGGAIADGVVLLEDGVIRAVGPASEVEIPDGWQVVEGAVVTPGLVDAHATVGLSGLYNTEADQDQLDETAPIQPGLRAIDAYNPLDPLVEWVRELGITTVHTGHGPGALVSGGTGVFKTSGETIWEAVVDSFTMLAMTLGPSVERNFESPGTGAKAVAMLRQRLIEAQGYVEARAGEDEAGRPARDVDMEALGALLSGEVDALVTAQRAGDIQGALRLAREFGFDLVIDGGAESYLLTEQIAEAGVPVFVHPTKARASGPLENASFTTAGVLHEAGVPVAFQSGYEAYVPKTRVALFEAAVAVAHGMPRQAALADLTIDGARLLGVADRVGSLEEGKDADLVVFDGDPFEYTTHACTVIIEGEIVSDACR